jgi:hypothetical protein
MSRHTTRKISVVCSEEAFNWLQAWIIRRYPIDKYPPEPHKHFYTNTSKRQYLSKWLEKVIVAVLEFDEWKPNKLPDAGKKIDNRKIVKDILGNQRTIGSETWVKDHRTRPGTADIICFFEGAKGIGQYNMEVKVGKDKMSNVQKLEEARAIRKKEFYNIIKTLDDFLDLYNTDWRNTQ